MTSDSHKSASIGFAAGVVVAFIIGLILVLRGPSPMEGYASGLAFETAPSAPPVRELRTTRFQAQIQEVWVELASAVHLESAIQLTVFDGFAPGMSDQEALERLGPPTGQWLDPQFRVVARYYDRPSGRVSLCPVPGSFSGVDWATVGYPQAATRADLVMEPSLLRQLLPLWPSHGSVPVQTSAIDGRVTLIMSAGDRNVLILRSLEAS